MHFAEYCDGCKTVDVTRPVLHVVCSHFLIFSPDGIIDILDILASGVPADFRNQVDLPSSRRCDLRQSKLHSVRWKPCRDELVGANVWRCHVPGLHAGPRRALGSGWWFERSVFAEKKIS